MVKNRYVRAYIFVTNNCLIYTLTCSLVNHLSAAAIADGVKKLSMAVLLGLDVRS